jgi:hypothetical protein
MVSTESKQMQTFSVGEVAKVRSRPGNRGISLSEPIMGRLISHRHFIINPGGE